jgi:acetyl esterase/lipase
LQKPVHAITLHPVPGQHPRPQSKIVAARLSAEGIKQMRKFALVLAAAAALCSCALAQEKPYGWPPPANRLTLPIWPGTVPDEPANMPPEQYAPDGHLVGGLPYLRLTDVSKPTITLYKAQTDNTGAAVLVFPGGAYKILSMDLEGTEICQWLNSIGVNCVLLKYRVPDSGPYPKSPAALEDAQRAMGLVREHAAEWGIDPNRLGVIGFSAGAHLAAALSTHYEKRLYAPVDDADKLSCRPDFAVVVYPGYLRVAEQGITPSPDIQPTSQTPPTFLLQAEDDPVHVENSIAYFLQLKEAGVPAELHIYALGGHGYGLRKTGLPISHWPSLVDTWLHTINMLPGK